jgi:DNA-binding response OmpR family regulator
LPGSDGRKVLAIEGDPETRTTLRFLLAATELELIQAADGGEGLRAFYAQRPDVVLLDLGLPNEEGWAVLASIRELSDTPILAVARDQEAERVRALRSGADDCVAEPVGGPELLARLEALLRRPRSQAEAAAAVLDDEFVHIDRIRHRVEVLGVEVALTPTEFRMLSTFAEHPGRVLGHGQLLEMVWGSGLRERDEVKLYVSYLRRKLGDAARVDPVETVRGVGYRYRPRRMPLALK